MQAVGHLDVAEKVLDEILVANKMHLPQFF